MTGVQMSYEEAEMLALMTLITFTNAGGLGNATLTHLMRFAAEAGDDDVSGFDTLQ